MILVENVVVSVVLSVVVVALADVVVSKYVNKLLKLKFS